MIRHQRARTSKNARRTANKLLRQIEAHVSDYKGRCLFVTGDKGEYCNEPVSNNCHIVSESAVLDPLKDGKTKNVRELQWGVSQWRELLFGDDVEQRVQDTSTFEPEKRTTKTACTGRFACRQCGHDNEFQPIDVAQPDFDDPVVRFLSGYRLVLFLADQCRKAISLRQPWDKAVMRNSKRSDRAVWFGEKEKLKKALRNVEHDVELLGKNWYAWKIGEAFDLSVVSAQVLNFRSKLRFAGGTLYGKATGVTVFPVQGDLHKIAAFHLTNKSGPAGQDIKRLAAVTRASEECQNDGVTVTNELMTNGWGSLAVSPTSYDALNERDRFAIQSLVAKQTQGSEIVKSFFRHPPKTKHRFIRRHL